MEHSNTMTDRTCEILDYIYNSEKPVGVSNIAGNLNLPKATVFRILASLEKWKFVEKLPDGDDYKLGLGMIKYGAKIASEATLIEISKSIIDDLSLRIGESVNLNIEYQEQSLNVYKSPIDNFILVSRLTPTSPLNCSASGKIFLSQKSDDVLKDYFNQKQYSKRTMNSIISYEVFMAEILKIREMQLAYDDEEYEYGLYCLAAPIYHRNKILAAVSISGPKTRLEYKDIGKIGGELKVSCEKITERIKDLEVINLF